MAEISIALATRNGAIFLARQLESFAVQTLLPTELVVFDDDSNDASVAEIERFKKNSPFPVRLKRNNKCLGARENFSQAISTCMGDTIALADQDDVWRTDKLERLAIALEPSGVLAAFSDARVVDKSLTPLGYTMWQRVRFTPREQARLVRGGCFNVLLKHYIVTGATLAFKASLRDTALPIPTNWPHDAWLALMAAAHGQIIAIPESLIDYRQHDTNAVGGLRKPLHAEIGIALAIDRQAWYREQITQWCALSDRLGVQAPAALAEKIAHLEARANLPSARWKRLGCISREILSGRYSRFARNWGSIAVDLLLK